MYGGILKQRVYERLYGGEQTSKYRYGYRERYVIVSYKSAEEFIGEYRKKMRRGIIAESTYRNVIFAITIFFEFLVSKFGMKEQYKITAKELDEFFSSDRLEKYKQSSLNKIIYYVGKYIRKLERYQGVFLDYEFSYKSVYGGKGKKKEDYEPVICKNKLITEKKIQEVFDKLYEMRKSCAIRSGIVYDRLRLILLLGTYTGIRGTEMQRLRVKHIDFENNIITVYRDKIADENRKITVVPLHPLLKAYLKYYIEKYNLKEDSRLLPIIVDKYLWKYGISKEINLRQLRRFFANYLFMKGKYLSLEYLMGHSIRWLNWNFLNTPAFEIKEITFSHYLEQVITNSKIWKEYFEAFGELWFDIHEPSLELHKIIH